MPATAKEIDIHLPYNYKCRPYQVSFWEAMRKKKRAVLVWHRRAGKEKTCWNWLITQAARKTCISYYFFPTYAHGRKILWDGIDQNGFRFIDHIPKELIAGQPNSTEMKIRLVNGSLIQMIGSDNVNSLVGTNPYNVVFSEYSLQDPKAWEFIRPILTENKGYAVFNFTPRGHNHAYDLYAMALNNPNWFCQKLTIDDTGVLNESDMQKERDEGMSEDMIQQEYRCSFTLGVEGSYYAKYVQDAKDQARIGCVPHQLQSRVYTAWDIGFGDSTAIIWYQIVGNSIHCIDYYENSGEGLPHYAQILESKRYLYADHYAPHDIDSHSFSMGLSAKEVGNSLGIKFTTLPTLKLRLEDGIEAARGIFPRVYFDKEKCKRLIKCLENYRKTFDQRLQVYKEKPLHDGYSHGSDAFRYLAIATKIHVDSGKAKIDDKQAEIWYDRYRPKFES